MGTRLRSFLLSLVPLSLCLGGDPAIHPAWPEASESSRPWTRWWWPGSAVSEAGLTQQLEALAKAGIGGVEITPIYGARGWEEDYVDFLSPRWLELLTHTGEEAQRLGLRVDMATGTGWPFGGPHVTEEHAAKRISWSAGEALLEPTRQTVKRAAPGGEGLVLDPFSADAINAYLDRFDAAFSALPNDNLLRAHFHDSFEYYGANWTDALPDRFLQMHAYALPEHLQALLGEPSGTADADYLARLKHDYRKTLDALHQDYLQAWTDWAHSRGWQTRNQSHGAPANLLDLYAIADIPETEVFGSTPFPIPGLRREADAIRHDQDLPEPLVTRMASSAAHVTGKPLASSETATWLRDHWKVTLAAVKPEIDRIFLDGINHVFYHGTVYSPPDAPWPGWLFYASTQFNPNNPWWQDFSALNHYVDRVQRILQSGEPGNDVLLYWPAHEIWRDPKGLVRQLTVHRVDFILDQPVGKLAQELRSAGYAFDYVSDRQIETLKARNGLIQAPGGAYATVIVPPLQTLPLETFERLAALARDGATILFSHWPEDVPGLGNLDERRERMSALKTDLRDAEHGRGNSLSRVELGNGSILLGEPIRTLAETTARPEPMVELGLESIRRVHPEGADYFIANLSAQPVDAWVPLGLPLASAVLLDPLSGHGGLAALRKTEGDGPEIRLQLAPGQSIVVRGRQQPDASGPAWTYLEPAGEARSLDGPWSLEFISGGPEMPERRMLEKLQPWTDLESPETQRFAGTARYSTRFSLDETEAAGTWILDLGDLRDSARVQLNGEWLPTVWSLPFHLRLGEGLRKGVNELRIEVTNTAANRIRDMDRRGVDWKIMREINFVDINYRPFDASEWEVQPAGLRGPVRLLPMRIVQP